MAEQHTFNIPSHNNIYIGTAINRELRIDFSVPENGVNANTGLLILAAGFNANIDSKVYKKMRERFADQYNLVTIQCDYFGSAYMQDTDNFFIRDTQKLQTIFTEEELKELRQNSSIFLDLLKEKDVVLPVEEKIGETLEDFNDMGYMQAIDIITAIEAVKIILNDNDLTFNSKRMIGYGNSHGSYLLHLCNVLAPNLFSYIIDNSAWLEPVYLTKDRWVNYKLGKSTLYVKFDYLARKVIKNREDLNLKMLYENYSGNTQILSFQGDNDNLVDFKDKANLMATINNSKLILVTEKDIDNKIYKTNTHGLNADFLELFSHALKYEEPNDVNCEIESKYTLDFQGVQIDVDSTLGLPVFQFEFK